MEEAVHCGKRGDVREERGQVLVLAAVAMVVFIALTGFALDVGHAYLVQRQLQAAVDAAALAGAQELPAGDEASAVAIAYGPTPGPNRPNALTSVANTVTDPPVVKCVVAMGCSSRRGQKNAIQVSASSVVPTFFARLVGRDSFTVRASATACSPCTGKKFDVMIVLDRTGSMTGDDLANAKGGIRQFLRAMDPGLDAVGLAVFPPAVDNSSVCEAPANANQRFGYNTWWPGWVPGASTPGIYAIAPPAQDYLIESPSGSGNWELNDSSALLQRLECVKDAGSTSYANALVEAKHELAVRGRSDAQDVIVFFTDGAANTMPAHGDLPAADGLLPLNLEDYGTVPSNGKALKPCEAGVAAAAWAKAQGETVIYTIGYDVQGNNGGSCGDVNYSAESALRAMASDADAYYAPNTGDDLGMLFDRIATDIRNSQTRLIDDSLT